VKYYNYEENTSSKIPYDKEPIFRQSTYKKAKSSGSGKNNKVLAFVVAILIIINIVFGVMLFSLFDKKTSSVNNNTIINVVPDTNKDISVVSTKAKLSVVCVHAGVTSLSSDYPDYQGFFNMSSKGAGVIFKDNKDDGDAYMLTCYHVVRGYTGQIFVLLYDSFVPVKASMVYYSSVYDIAVLKVSALTEYIKSSAKPAEIADSSMLIEGDVSIAVGNPLGAGIAVTSGNISKTVDLVKVDGVTHRVMRTDAPINNGNSGGGLFNNKGELIGIVNAKATDNISNNSFIDSVAYAIPSNVAVSLGNNIIENKMPVKATLGIEMMVDPSVDSSDGSTGVVFDVIDGKVIPVQSVIVSRISEGSKFEMYDKITGFSYGDTVVKMVNLYSFDDHAFNLKIGDKVTFFIERDGKEKTLSIIIKEVVSADYEDWYGL